MAATWLQKTLPGGLWLPGDGWGKCPSICPPSPTVLNIGQFLDEDAEEQGWDQSHWLLVYALAFQHVGEAADGRTWRPNGKHFSYGLDEY